MSASILDAVSPAIGELSSPWVRYTLVLLLAAVALYSVGGLVRSSRRKAPPQEAAVPSAPAQAPPQEAAVPLAPALSHPHAWYYSVYPVVIACGYLGTWFNTQRTDAVKWRMARVNEQLQEFYGPLQSLTATTRRSYEAMVQEYLNVSLNDSAPIDNLETMRRWKAALQVDVAATMQYRLWATEVYQPLNERALEIIVRRADLMDTTAVPLVFQQFLAYTTAFRTVLARWRVGDFSLTGCSVKYPKEFEAYIGAEFRRLKLQQAAHLRILHTDERDGEDLLQEQLAAGVQFVQMKDMAKVRAASGHAQSTALEGVMTTLMR